MDTCFKLDAYFIKKCEVLVFKPFQNQLKIFYGSFKMLKTTKKSLSTEKLCLAYLIVLKDLQNTLRILLCSKD